MQCVVLTAVFVCVLHLSVYTLQYESVYVAAVSIQSAVFDVFGMFCSMFNVQCLHVVRTL